MTDVRNVGSIAYLPNMTFQPAGWYPDPLSENARLRWFDGEEWGDATKPRFDEPTASDEPHSTSAAPTNQAPTPQWSPAGPPPPPVKKSHRTAYVVGGVFVVLVLIGGIASAVRGDKDDDSAAASDATTSAVTTTTIDPAIAAAQSASASAEAAASASAVAAADAARQRERAALRDRSTYREVGDRGWALIAKNPAAHVGEMVKIYGHVTQFDTATGTFTLRANTSGVQQENSYEYDQNTIVDEGSAGAFADVVADDLVTLYVEVSGSQSYDTTMGGSTSAPKVVAYVVDVTGSDG